MEVVATLLIAVVMTVGLACTVVPVVPGVLVMWLGALAYAAVAGFEGLTWTMLGVITALALAGGVASLVLPTRGGYAAGAPSGLIPAAALGAVVGAVVIPVVGLPVGALAGAYFRSLSATGDAREASRVVVGMLRGIGVGSLVEFATGLVIVVIWIGWVVATW